MSDYIPRCDIVTNFNLAKTAFVRYCQEHVDVIIYVRIFAYETLPGWTVCR